MAKARAKPDVAQLTIDVAEEPVKTNGTAPASITTHLIDVERIVIRAGHNARRDVGDITELAASIKELGLLQALVVVPSETGAAFDLVAGERRLTAVRKLGWKQVDCKVVTLEDRLQILAMVVENVQREDLDPLEEADAYRRAVEAGFQQKDVAQRVGRSEAHVSKRLALLDLPEPAQVMVSAGKVTLADAVELTKLKDHPDRVLEAIRFAERSPYQGITGAVQLIQKKAAQQKAVDDAVRGLERRGIPIVLRGELGYGAPLYTTKFRALGGQSGPAASGYEPFPFTVKQHEGLPCHGAVVDGVGQVVYVCSDVKQHPELKKEQVDPRAAERQKELRKNKQRKLEAAARVEAAQSLLVGPLEQHLQYVAAEMAELAQIDEARIACEMIGLEAEKARYGSHEYQSALAKYAGESKRMAWQVLMALAMSRAENALRSQYHKPGPSDKAYRDLLGAAGYVKPKLAAAPKKKSAAKPRRGPEPEETREQLRARLFGQDGWTEWEPAITHPTGATTDHQPTVEERMWDWGRDEETPATGHLEYRGACRNCDWRGVVRPLNQGGENGAVMDAHDHAFPGWRDLPILDENRTWRDHDGRHREKRLKPVIEAAIAAGYPADYVERHGPIRERRDGVFTRCVPGYSPFGGYAIAVVEIDPAEETEAAIEAGIIPDSPEPVIEDYPEEERERILLDTASEVMHAADRAVGDNKAALEQTAADLVKQASAQAAKLQDAVGDAAAAVAELNRCHYCRASLVDARETWFGRLAARKGEKIGEGRSFCHREPCRRACEQERQLGFTRRGIKVTANDLSATEPTHRKRAEKVEVTS